MRRLLTPVAKFWICKRGSHFAEEAMECLGGNGRWLRRGGRRGCDGTHLPRDAGQPRSGRAPANIMALDLRVLRKGAEVADALEAELAPARVRTLRSTVSRPPCRAASTRPPPRPTRAAWHRTSRLRCRRRSCASIAPDVVFDAFCRSRLGGDWGQAFQHPGVEHAVRRDHWARAAGLSIVASFIDRTAQRIPHMQTFQGRTAVITAPPPASALRPRASPRAKA